MPRISANKAIAKLNAGEVVALPTETVYGLAGMINHPEAIEKIFTTKSRPYFDPLIVHVTGVEQARRLAKNWSKAHQILSEAFWPGPLTLIATKTELVSELITSGLDTVALRSPKHPLAQQILSELGAPVAAPSANRFGRTSPTSADHVISEFSDQVPVVDGGPCQVGLESSICSLICDTDEKVTVNFLRRGVITAEQVEQTLQQAGIACEIHYLENAQGPGNLKDHYQPDIPFFLFPATLSDSDISQQVGKTLSMPIHLSLGAELRMDSSPQMAARTLYSQLRTLAKSGSSFIFCRWPEEHTSEDWLTIYDRLKKASFKSS